MTGARKEKNVDFSVRVAIFQDVSEIITQNGIQSEGIGESDPIGKAVRRIKKLGVRLDGARMMSDHIKVGIKTTDRKG